MRNKIRITKLFTLFIFICLVCSHLLYQRDIQASQLPWGLSLDDTGHNYINLKVYNISKAETVNAHITIGPDVIEKRVAFSSLYIQQIRLDLDKYYAANTEFTVYFEDESGTLSESKSGAINKCNMPDFYATAYPKKAIGQILGSASVINEIKAVIDNNDIIGTIDKSNNFVIDYSDQSVSGSIQIIASCAHGCEKILNKNIVNEYIRKKSVIVKRDKIVLNYDWLDKDEVLYAQIGNQLYKSKKGSDYSVNDTAIITYPLQSVGTKVSYWVENGNGSKSEITEINISECKLTTSNIEVHPNHLTGKLSDRSGENNEYVVVEIGNNKYRANVIYSKGNDNLSFKVKYPNQKKGQKMTIHVYDGHGCVSSTKEVTLNPWNWSAPNIQTHNRLANRFLFRYTTRSRLCVKIDSKTYYSSFSGSDVYLSVSFPVQKVGKQVTCWLEDENGKYSDSVELKVTDPKIQLTDVTLRSNLISGSAQYGLNSMSSLTKVKSVSVQIGKKTYKKTYEKAVNKFEIKFPNQKIGTKVKVSLVDQNGYSLTKTVTMKNTPIKLKVGRVKYGQNKITGSTEAEARVTAVIDKKTYKAKANAKGKFSISIPFLKSGTRITIKATNSFGFHNTKKLSAENVMGSVRFSHNLYINTRTVNIAASNVFRGERIVVFINGTAYTHKINTDAKSYRANISIGDHGAGSNAEVVLYDKFGSKRDSDSQTIYIGDTISVGMTAQQVLLTSWGEPTRKNVYGSLHQWVYQRDRGFSYVYIRNGVVTSLSNY